MTPWSHAESSAEQFGGIPEDYIRIHDWLDETKQYTGDCLDFDPVTDRYSIWCLLPEGH